MLHTDMQDACSATEPEDQMLRYKGFMMPALGTPWRLFWSVVSTFSREAHHSTEWGQHQRVCGSPSAPQQECCRGRQHPPRPGGTCWRRQGAWCASQTLAPCPSCCLEPLHCISLSVIVVPLTLLEV